MFVNISWSPSNRYQPEKKFKWIEATSQVVFISLFSWLFLKEPCGIFHMCSIAMVQKYFEFTSWNSWTWIMIIWQSGRLSIYINIFIYLGIGILITYRYHYTFAYIGTSGDLTSHPASNDIWHYGGLRLYWSRNIFDILLLLSLGVAFLIILPFIVIICMIIPITIHDNQISEPVFRWFMLLLPISPPTPWQASALSS